MPEPCVGDTVQVTTIQARGRWRLVDFGELLAYRDLYRFLVRREIKVRYAQSAIGVGWAILQPLFAMLVFTVIFGRLARVSSDGVPYALFSFAGLVPWMYFANGVTDGVNSLINNAHMLSKVYFPRLLLPLAAVSARLVDYFVAAVVMIGMLLWYRVTPTWNLLALPWIVTLMFLSATAGAVWLASFALQYRDVKHAMSFVVQILMYTAPVVYPLSLIPVGYHWLLALNPMVGVIEGLRAGLFGARDMPWQLLIISSLSGVFWAMSGVLNFNNRQSRFADVA
jgi:lipopolysaccharide transport system permease protein